MQRVQAGKPISLGTSNLGASAVLSTPKPGSSASPSPSSSASPSPSSISGLKGQTAAEQTCSVAASS